MKKLNLKMKPKSCPFCKKKAQERTFNHGIKGWSIFHSDDCYIKMLIGHDGFWWEDNRKMNYSSISSDFIHEEEISIWNMRCLFPSP